MSLRINYCINDKTGDCDIYDNNDHIATICDCCGTDEKVLRNIITETIENSIHIQNKYSKSEIQKGIDEFYEGE